ncbi:DUF3592 domain-containing protein [Pseudoflavonifractor capillosus]|uniref:DUF3592 domain-containing protein n=1 Tax=Pseudoflavonifractor capillosus TaxID=106588 RepID=UPI00195AB6A4|nr:DUF3592 domain-containing protein [Pseudoflavonifractor capillosus]MBM6681662.1 hypothetical protein [Pseudoflavonifractor capillosus]
MRPPNSISALCAMTFGLLGAAFVAIGTLYGCLGVSIRGAASSWAFLPIGVVCLLIGLVCALVVRRRRREGRLRSAGIAVPGTIVQVRRHIFIRWERESFSSWPGRNSPWSVRCTYEYEGRTYGVDSGLLWKEPAPGLQHPTVYVDHTHPKRAWVDLDTVVLLA